MPKLEKTKSGLWKCPACGFTNKVSGPVASHFFNTHLSPEERAEIRAAKKAKREAPKASPPSSSAETGKYKCGHCGKEFDGLTKLLHHIEGAHPEHAPEYTEEVEEAPPKPQKKTRQFSEDDWAGIQAVWGCPGCYYADPAALGKSPCCTFPAKLKTDVKGRCIKRKSADVVRSSKPLVADAVGPDAPKSDPPFSLDAQFDDMLAMLHKQENAKRLVASDDGDAEVWEMRAMEPLNDTLFVIDIRQRRVWHIQRKDDPQGYAKVAKEATSKAPKSDPLPNRLTMTSKEARRHEALNRAERRR